MRRQTGAEPLSKILAFLLNEKVLFSLAVIVIFYLIYANRSQPSAPTQSEQKKTETFEFEEESDTDSLEGILDSNGKSDNDDDSFDAVVPATAVGIGSSSSSLAFSPIHKLNIDRLKATNLEAVLKNDYDKTYTQFDADVELPDIVQRVHGNVGAITYGRGRPFGTGILIRPDLFLTARHCIEGEDLNRLSIQFQYQRVNGYIYTGGLIEIEHIAETSDELDYVILKLKRAAPGYTPLKISNELYHGNEFIIIHHRNGSSKKVSVHAIAKSQFEFLVPTAFHDTHRGSSGAPYIGTQGELFAIHCRRNTTCSGVWLKDIIQRSAILQGKKLRTPITFLPISDSKKEDIERVDKPLGFEAKNPCDSKHERHHIIPIGDMEFLWLLGQESSSLGNLLKEISYEKGTDVYSFAWATWNLFVGPKERSDNPKDRPERVRPQSFDAKKWDGIKIAQQCIDKCWTARHQLQADNKEFKDFHDGTIKKIEEQQHGNLFDGVKKSHPKYSKYKEELIELQKAFRALIAVTKGPKKIMMHAHKSTDWNGPDKNGKYNVIDTRGAASLSFK